MTIIFHHGHTMTWCDSSFRICRSTWEKQLAENNWSEIQSGKQLAEYTAAENSSQALKINSAKYSANFVILLYYQQNYHTINYKINAFQAIILLKKLCYA